MSISKEINESGKWETYSTGGGFAGTYRYMGRDVLLSEVAEGGGESQLSLKVVAGKDCGHRLSFLYQPVETAKKGPVTIMEIEGLVRITQDDFTAPGAFNVDFTGGRRLCPDYSLFTEKWNCFELLIMASGSIDLLINGRCWAKRDAPAPGLGDTAKITIGCGENPARSMWDRFRFEDNRERDVRLTSHVQQRHDFFESVVFDNPDMHMVFDARCVRGEDLYTQGDWQYPGFQTGSTLYGRPLADSDEQSCFGVRWHGKAEVNPSLNRIELHCHQDYELEVHGAGGSVVAFSTTSTTTFNPLRCTATYYLFSRLPGIIFCSSYVDNIFHEPQPELAGTSICYMMFTRGDRDSDGNPHDPAYDGFRLWPVAGERLDYFYAQDSRRHYKDINEADSENGLYLRWPRNNEGYYGVWFVGPTDDLARGLAVMQKGGKNDWEVNPPIGNIFADDRHFGTFTAAGGEYTSMATAVKLPGDLSAPGSGCENEIIFFSLKPECPVCTEAQLYDLERSFNLPLAISVDSVREGNQPGVYACELDGLERKWQIVSLPWVYGDMEFQLDAGDVFHGSAFSGRKPVKTVLLMSDVEAHGRTLLGRLPVSISKGEQGQWVVESGLSGSIESIWIEIKDDRRALRSVAADRGFIKTWRVYDGKVEIFMDLEPGVTKIELHGGKTIWV